MSLVITLCLLTIFIILSLDIGTVNIQDKFFETASAQVFNNTKSVIQNKTAESTIPADRSLLLKLLADNLENRLNKSAAILEIAGELPQVKNASYASSISSELHGIPKDLDNAKRKVAHDILASDKDLQLIFFLMPNGDMYMEEPYSRQQNLTGNNFAFRDYYKGAISTGDTYLGNVVISASSGLPQSNIAVPLYSSASDNNGNNSNNMTLLGIWSGGLNLTEFSETLQSLNLTDGERIVYVDQNGLKVADSNKQSFRTNQNESFAGLQAFNNAIQEQKPSSITEMLNGTRMLVFYEPVQFHSTTWAVLLLKPL
ncbi:MAG TPA: cache domain-containing protein [Nitrososphaeraceae archaeon]|nr:cache domain-containing protein [Nitrososphaeraceae archaeon]